MLLAAVGDTTYNVVLFLHILSFLVAFAPTMVNPLLKSYLERNGGEPVLRSWAGFTSNYTRVFALGGLGVLFVTGILLIVLSDEFFEFSDPWISVAFLVWFAIGGVVSAMVLKGEKQLAAGDMAGSRLVDRGTQITAVLLLVMLYLMIFKPGA